MRRWLLLIAAVGLTAMVLLASWTSPRDLPRLVPLYVNRPPPASSPHGASSKSIEQSIRGLLASLGKRFRWRWSGSSEADPAPGDKYADALRLMAAWSEQHEADDDCVAVLRDVRHGGEICVVSQ